VIFLKLLNQVKLVDTNNYITKISVSKLKCTIKIKEQKNKLFAKNL
jgi:hypothetical protein